MTDSAAFILIVDDDFDFLELNRLILERAGYRVATAADPAQALRTMAQEKPDLVITDLMMTSLDSGFSFSRAIKEEPAYADIPVIIATSVSAALGLDFRPRSAEESVTMNVDAYFDKPLDAPRLLAKVAELLAAQKVTTAEVTGPEAAAPAAAPEAAPAAAPEPSAPEGGS
jgi:twitching motility two-component system response regulator PilH